MAKSPDAFRTISEVADWLGVQAHVLRFWESKFSQVKPIKRAGGRRYYRPSDMLLIGGLKKLLHEDGLTIKGAQRLLREKGVSFVADLSQPLDDLTAAVIEGNATRAEVDAGSEQVHGIDLAQPEEPLQGVEGDMPDATDEMSDAEEPEDVDQIKETLELDSVDKTPSSAENEANGASASDVSLHQDFPDAHEADTAAANQADEDPLEESVAAEPEEDTQIPQFRSRHRDLGRHKEPPPIETDVTEAQAATEPPVPDETPAHETDAPAFSSPQKPRIVDLPPIPPHHEIEVSPSALSALAGVRRLTAQEAREIKPLLARLTRLHASMANPRKDIGKD